MKNNYFYINLYSTKTYIQKKSRKKKLPALILDIIKRLLND